MGVGDSYCKGGGIYNCLYVYVVSSILLFSFWCTQSNFFLPPCVCPNRFSNFFSLFCDQKRNSLLVATEGKKNRQHIFQNRKCEAPPLTLSGLKFVKAKHFQTKKVVRLGPNNFLGVKVLGRHLTLSVSENVRYLTLSLLFMTLWPYGSVASLCCVLPKS